MLPKILNVTHEEAILISQNLADRSVHETPSIQITSGYHPEHGPIHVLIPAMGGYAILPALLPVVFREGTL